METILKTGYEKIMRIFYDNKNKKFHLREIARETKLNANSVSRFLKKLEEEKLLRAEKQANLKIFRIIKNLRTFSLFSFLDIERFEKLPQIRRNAINYFFEKLKEKPILIILFGSTAKESFSKESDIDLFLIVNKKIKTSEAENYVDAQTGIKINSFQMPYPRFLRELKMGDDKVLLSAVNTGYPVLNHTKYYEIVLK